ncbi:unnamed protein product [Amoebophrya sp. A120]|nr:unnamed protein product [Amoebophrya sp. A120]|eukprot:GSA120T00023723001.1
MRRAPQLGRRVPPKVLAAAARKSKPNTMVAEIVAEQLETDSSDRTPIPILAAEAAASTMEELVRKSQLIESADLVFISAGRAEATRYEPAKQSQSGREQGPRIAGNRPPRPRKLQRRPRSR